MNPVREQILMVFGVLFAVVVVGLMLVYLAPYSGSASAGIGSTGTEFDNLLPFVGMLVVGMAALLAMEGRRRS